jgi:hypothetical protein
MWHKCLGTTAGFMYLKFSRSLLDLICWSYLNHANGSLESGLHWNQHVRIGASCGFVELNIKHEVTYLHSYMWQALIPVMFCSYNTSFLTVLLQKITNVFIWYPYRQTVVVPQSLPVCLASSTLASKIWWPSLLLPLDLHPRSWKHYWLMRVAMFPIPINYLPMPNIALYRSELKAIWRNTLGHLIIVTGICYTYM